MKKFNVGILGATGAVGQNYALLLNNHPWFNVTYLAASSKNESKTYSQALENKWFMDKEIPNKLKNIILADASKPSKALELCDFIFSSYESSKEEICNTEMEYARLGIPVISNNSAHRWTKDVPMIIPEINYNHLGLIGIQKKNRGFSKGFVVTKPNCSIQSFLTPVYALIANGYFVDKIIATTLQAISGAGYPGVPSLDIIDNIVPYIGGEEEKTELEPLKILGNIVNESINNYDKLKISATCTRVPVINGHTASINLSFVGIKPSLDEIISTWNNFTSEPQRLNLPSAPKKPIIYLNEENRPQPRKDRDNDKAMAVSVGRLRECDIFDIKFIGLSHNTIRGAAGGAILTAELLAAKDYL
ncbi:MAG: aspartate-semialdehyde dehydrogenase [Candidatus Nanoarchaeia archaeon]|nr:aspartate-semialdehyde dehydrogenase [Candidatus Nanoarchaeia archaeon]